MHDTSIHTPIPSLYDITSRVEKYRRSLFSHPLLITRDVLEFRVQSSKTPTSGGFTIVSSHARTQFRRAYDPMSLIVSGLTSILAALHSTVPLPLVQL
jgi:hypothetical protein